MAVKAAPTLPKFRLPKAPPTPKPKPLVVKGALPAKIKPPALPRTPSLMTLKTMSYRGLAPQKQLAKAAAGASAVSGKRNPFYPTP